MFKTRRSKLIAAGACLWFTGLAVANRVTYDAVAHQKAIDAGSAVQTEQVAPVVAQEPVGPSEVQLAQCSADNVSESRCIDYLDALRQFENAQDDYNAGRYDYATQRAQWAVQDAARR